MESDSKMIPFPLLPTPIESNYRACTIPYRFPSDNPRIATPTEISWINVFAKSIPSFKYYYFMKRLQQYALQIQRGSGRLRSMASMESFGSQREGEKDFQSVPRAIHAPYFCNVVVKVDCTIIEPDYSLPWKIKHQERKRAETDPTVLDAPSKAKIFAERYGGILEDWKQEPESHGGPPDIILLGQIREQILRELGFKDIFKQVKEEENAKAILLFPEVVNLNDAIEDESKRLENLVRGIFAGNIFDLGSPQLAEVFSKEGISFLTTCQNLVPRPWVIDDLDNFQKNWIKKRWKKAVIFVDNSGADIILGILPFAREMLRQGMQVVLAANELPSINDVTHTELSEILSQLKDENGKLLGVDTSNLLIANSGNDLPVIDLTKVSQELAYLSSDADLVVLEGMGRGIETNLYAKLKCDSLKIGMVKHVEVSQFLGGRLYDCVFHYNQVPHS